MKKITSIFYALFCFGVLFGQPYANRLNDLSNEVNSRRLARGEVNVKYLENPLDQYLLENFEEGELKVHDKKELKKGIYNYNILTDRIQYIMDGDTFAIENPEKIEFLKINDRVVKYCYYKTETNIYSGFFEQFNVGKYQLLYKRKMQMVGEQPTNGYREAQPPHYRQLRNYYLIKDNKVAYKLTGKRKLIKYFEEEGIDAKTIMKEHKIKYRKAESLKKLFEIASEQKGA